MKDWVKRTIKTFVQAFGGVFIPELCLLLSGALPEDFTALKAILIPLVCSALSAGICAAWNVILEHLKAGESDAV